MPCLFLRKSDTSIRVYVSKIIFWGQHVKPRMPLVLRHRTLTLTAYCRTGSADEKSRGGHLLKRVIGGSNTFRSHFSILLSALDRVSQIFRPLLPGDPKLTMTSKFHRKSWHRFFQI